MRQEIRVEPKKQYLYVEVSGAFDSSKAKEFILQIFQACHHYGLRKVFVDIRHVEGPIPIIKRFELATFMAAEQSVPIRLAVLESPEQVPDDRFFEDVAVNRGAAVKVATELEDALNWLERE